MKYPNIHRVLVYTGSARCCCYGSVGTIETLVSDTWKCGSSSFIFIHPPEDEKNIPGNIKKKVGEVFLGDGLEDSCHRRRNQLETCLKNQRHVDKKHCLILV